MTGIGLKVGLGLATLLTGVGIVGGTEQASAATWHAGTPTVLRGKFLSTMSKHKTALGFATQYQITKTRIERGESGMSYLTATKLSWRKIGKIYYVRCKVKPNGMLLGGKATMKFYMAGKNTFYEDPTAHKLKQGYAYKRVDKFRTWY